MTDAPTFDAARLIADVRKGDPVALKQAYAVTFGNDLGRLVLAHHLAECGVGNALGVGGSTREMAYQAGRHDAALQLVTAAALDQASLVVAILTDNLEGTTDDDAFNYRSEPEGYIPDDDDF